MTGQDRHCQVQASFAWNNPELVMAAATARGYLGKLQAAQSDVVQARSPAPPRAAPVPSPVPRAAQLQCNCCRQSHRPQQIAPPGKLGDSLLARGWLQRKAFVSIHSCRLT
jgi:hypothetical protein